MVGNQPSPDASTFDRIRAVITNSALRPPRRNYTGDVIGTDFHALADTVIEIVAEHTAGVLAQLERTHALLDQPCGSCHPCDNWPAETWRRAGRSLPHVHEWDELRAEVDELRRARSVLASGVSLLADLDVELRSERAALWELLKTQTRRLVECREDYWELSAECSALDNEVAELRERRTDGGDAR